MQAVETTAFQGVVVMAGYLAAPDRNVAAMGITFNLCGLAFMASYGIAGAHTRRVAVCCRVAGAVCCKSSSGQLVLEYIIAPFRQL